MVLKERLFMRKISVSRVVAMLTLLLTTAAFVVSGSPVSYAASAHLAAVPASVTVAENPLTEDTSGSFIATVNGRGLYRNTLYILTDNNYSCVDSINIAGSLTVWTDLEGRFSLPLLGGPSLLGGAPCSKGKFTITARVAVLPSIFLTTTFKIQPPTSFGNIHTLTFNPNPAVLSTRGTFISTLYGKGWHPGKIFSALIVTSSCGLTGFTTSAGGTVDGDGNFAVGIGGVTCNAGTVKLLVVVGTAPRLITLHLTPPSL